MYYDIIETLLKGSKDRWWQSYPETEKPIFFGHYWMSSNASLQGINSMCVDHSVAKNGVLCAYRWSGEKQLQVDNILAVST